MSGFSAPETFSFLHHFGLLFDCEAVHIHSISFLGKEKVLQGVCCPVPCLVCSFPLLRICCIHLKLFWNQDAFSNHCSRVSGGESQQRICLWSGSRRVSLKKSERAADTGICDCETNILNRAICSSMDWFPANLILLISSRASPGASYGANTFTNLVLKSSKVPKVISPSEFIATSMYSSFQAAASPSFINDSTKAIFLSSLS